MKRLHRNPSIVKIFIYCIKKWKSFDKATYLVHVLFRLNNFSRIVSHPSIKFPDPVSS